MAPTLHHPPRLVGIVAAPDLATSLVAASVPRGPASITRTGIPVVAPDDRLDIVMEPLERAGARSSSTAAHSSACCRSISSRYLRGLPRADSLVISHR
jgi:hypothetical protein